MTTPILPTTLQISLLNDHAHTTHNAVKYINVYVNIYDVAVVVPWGSGECKQTVVIVGQLKVISIKMPEKILQSVKSSAVKM